ncbi:cytochrome c biogenesis CcdA family protein [Clostridium thermarum]|uniref:cytochrome c biogenesis CcdA family protein n=1 Tax=Clostridium thermarum TaxID=1716543 RepID=UPI0013D4D392|nr:cytochrome c biogenesis protein CcdA [Clostridium thermarum]
MNNVSIILAFAAGLLSFLSPCVLPLVPAYISYLTGTSAKIVNAQKTKLYAVYKALGFVIGFSIIFIIMGASATSLGRLFLKHQNTFRMISGILIIIFGIHTTGLLKVKLFYREFRFLKFSPDRKSYSSILMGMAFAGGWTPCVGPILGSILLYASNLSTIYKGILLLVVYSLGLATPFLLTAYAIDQFTNLITKYRKYLPSVSIISGILMIIMGVLIFTNKLSILAQYFNFINF